ncbi:hypothetical protein GGI07_000643 [Coemansia sp. Benny D115]|nr:hypothetical protein GGI07_000643 [Coemansia sp. Benny D115]
MWLNKPKISLGDYTYLLYPVISLVTIAILSCRIASTRHSHSWHRVPSPWSTVVSFGDNFSDSGNGAHITGGKYPSEPWFWHHRFTNGPNWVDNLILDLGGLGKIKMRNFAHGGASSDNALWPGALLGHPIPGTHQQVRGFIAKSRKTGYAASDRTLYTLWTGANDCLALGKAGGFGAGRNFQVDDVIESIYQDILQMERESHNQVTQVVVLTPPPVEDMPLVRHESPDVQRAVRAASQKLTRDLPHGLLERFSRIGHTEFTDSIRQGPLEAPHQLPNHRKRVSSPITHYLSVSLPQDYNHLLPHEHNGTHHQPFHPVPRVHKRSPPNTHRLQIMVYDAYHFIKHAQTNPVCFGFDPHAVNQTCGDRKTCYDRVWLDDSNINTAVHYWMARDINVRLHMWHLHTAGASINSMFKNSTRARELELEMLGYACPMKPAPTSF